MTSFIDNSEYSTDRKHETSDMTPIQIEAEIDVTFLQRKTFEIEKMAMKGEINQDEKRTMLQLIKAQVFRDGRFES